MKPIKNVGVALLLFSLLFNPFTLGNILSDDGTIDNLLIILVILALELIFFLAGFVLLWDPSLLLSKWKEILLLLVTVSLTYSLLLILDKTAFVRTGVIYEFDYREDFERLEHDYNVSINSLGIRDREVDLSKPHSFVVGDSFVWGVGVNVEDSIPHRLSYHSGESFLNVGHNGGSVHDYIINYQKIRKIIEPELVVLVVYLGNDVMMYNIKERSTLSSFLRFFTLTNIWDIKSPPKIRNCEILPKNPEDLPPHMYENYLTINTTLYEMATQEKECHKQDINPATIRKILEVSGKSKKKTEQEIQSTMNALELFHKTAEKNEDEVLIVFLPGSTNLSKRYESFLEQLGLDRSQVVDTSWLSTQFMHFCSEKKYDCLDTTSFIKNHPHDLFWQYDGHFNREGNDVVAQVIADYLFRES